jgi:N-methylhydantoinase A
MLLGIDIGGTFTDFVYFNGQSLRMHKVLSTPDAPERAISQGIKEMDILLNNLRVIHGSTVATNAVLEGKGARTVYIANRGLKDVLTIGRQARRELYNLQPEIIDPPVPDQLCLETGGRINANAEVIDPLTKDDIVELLATIKKLKPQAAAINFLFSYVDNQHEQLIAKSLPPDLFISCSSSILAEHREYERGITTWLNAYVGPLMQGYLQQLENQLNPASLSIMRSSGNTCSAEQAGKEAVHQLLSGPAGGLSGAHYIGQYIGSNRLLTFDMGGTSTDVALIDGEISLTSQGQIADYPVGISMVDMHTIGAGGGSIAYLDAGGALQVGPESAGAVPGPACYGQDGKQVTVTDANLILGHLPRTALLGGTMQLDYESAYNALSSLVNHQDQISVEEIAEGIIRITNEHMVQALRKISVHRGVDPREFVLIAFGGAGGMHVCALADALGIRQAMAPIQAGVLSALGMIVAPPGRQLSRTLSSLMSNITDNFINSAINDLAEQAKLVLADEGVDTSHLKQSPSLDICYQGQSFTLNISWNGLTEAEKSFHEQHEKRFGHRLDMPVEVINVRLGITADLQPIELVANNWQCKLDRIGNLLLVALETQ